MLCRIAVFILATSSPSLLPARQLPQSFPQDHIQRRSLPSSSFSSSLAQSTITSSLHHYPDSRLIPVDKLFCNTNYLDPASTVTIDGAIAPEYLAQISYTISSYEVYWTSCANTSAITANVAVRSKFNWSLEESALELPERNVSVPTTPASRCQKLGISATAVG